MIEHDFAYRVRLARGAVGLTQKDLGAAVGVHAKSVSAWERGEKKLPRASTLFRLCAALHVTQDWLLHGEGQGPTQPVPTVIPGALAVAHA